MGALAGRNLIEFAGGVSTKSLTISSNALPVYAPAGMATAISGVNISNSSLAVHAAITGVNVSSSSLAVHAALTGVNVSNSSLAVHAALTGLQTSLSSLQIIDNTPSSLSKAISVSTGTVKASAGTLFMILPSTAGDIQIKDGDTVLTRIAVTTVPINFGPWGIPFGTTISMSASSAVATYVYK